MRAKRVYEFLKTSDVRSSLGIGRVASIRELFREYGIPDDDYVITDNEVIFEGDLFLSRTSIAELPEGLRVEGDLRLSGTPIKKLPEGLRVGGYLDLSGTNITELPEWLKVGINLDLSQATITKLPKGLNVGRHLELFGTGITELPEWLSVGGLIYIYGSQEELKNYIESSNFEDKLRVW